MTTDSTQLRRMGEEALQASNERFQALLEAAPLGIVIVDCDGRIARVNANAEAMFGYDRGRLIGQTVEILLPEGLRKVHVEHRADYLADPSVRPMGIGLDIAGWRQDGTEFPIEVTLGFMETEDGPRIMSFSTDITKRKQMEDELQRLTEELEQRVIDRTRELSTLYDVTAVASESLDLRTTLDRSLEPVVVDMEAHVGLIHLLDEAGETLHLAAQQGTPSNISAHIDGVRLGSGLAGRVIERGEPLMVPDLAADPRVPHVTHEEGTHTYAAVPMRAGGRALGVLSVCRERERQFSVEEVALLTSIADHVAVAVENARLYEQTQETATLKERQRVARELYDSVVQSLYCLTLLAGGWRRMAEAGELEDLKEPLTELGDTAQQALKEMRLLVHELRPSVLEEEELVGTLQRRLDAVEGRAGVKARLLVEGAFDLPTAVEEELYHIAQEALNNALKHAAATSVTVAIRAEDGWLVLEVQDDGRGFNPNTVSSYGGMGLINMRERAERLGGSLVVESTPGAGTRVDVRIPMSSDQ